MSSPGAHNYAEGQSVPVRFALTSLVPGSAWSITIQYHFENGTDHFFDSLSTFNTTIPLTSTQACEGRTFTSGPNIFAIPTDTSLPAGAQVPGNFTVFNGSITSTGVYSPQRSQGTQSNVSLFQVQSRRVAGIRMSLFFSEGIWLARTNGVPEAAQLHSLALLARCSTRVGQEAEQTQAISR